ncbi:MAG: 2-oxoglutarate dehydrogenase E1 component [Parvicellaceae bacterium]|jgi:2-oxoglutarate dehydrogenase E1 component
MDKFSYLSNAHGSSIEELYNQYIADNNSVDFGWQKFFEGFEFAQTNFEATGAVPENMHKEFKIVQMINEYRGRGHLFTQTNPVRERRKYSPSLKYANFKLEESDLNVKFSAGSELGIGDATLQEIIDHLEETYCGSIGIEYAYMRSPKRLKWMREKIELKNRPILSGDTKKHILHKLNQANGFEQFLQKKFVGQKRFSLEGGEALIPALDALIERGSEMGVENFVMGMAHRGRLNVLANIFNKPYTAIFSEFEGKEYENSTFDGDVKYHLGFTSETLCDSGNTVQMTLCPNPSHLEAVDPVAQGLTRSIIDHKLGGDSKKIVPIIIHGDAAIAGQGVVYEVVQMAQLDGYQTGGTVHIVINNQIGFTTNYLDARSSTYCTDVAKTTLCPVFHVNGDDVEAVVQVMQIALEYRQEFGRDVFIDLLCYRKYGHNEGDEPKFTQPKLYKSISKHPNPRDVYMSKLIADEVITADYAKESLKEFDDSLQDKLEDAKKIKKAKVRHFLEEEWSHLKKAKYPGELGHPKTQMPTKKLVELGTRLATLPDGKKFFRKSVKLANDRLQMLEDDKLDWGMAEMLAYASLLSEGHPVRISGQDVERGTFSHRHAVIKTEDSEEEIITLNNVSEGQAKFEIYNSLLSEYAVLGFDYGYAFGTPDGLIIWEAQFGDFNNGAQIIIDQFISAAEDKWHTMNGLVMLLPHGYEGMGSEHSSGRMERYLQLCAENNMIIINCTLPGNHYHALRRQLKWEYRKPLIAFTPKKLLRYHKAVSSIDDLAKGEFRPVIDDDRVDPKNVDTVAYVSGKFYFDILEKIEEIGGADNIALVRVEQIYPLPQTQLDATVVKYSKATKHIWVQEEPENMGAWSFILRKWRTKHLELISRSASGSPAAGSSKVHEIRHNALINELLENAKQLA